MNKYAFRVFFALLFLNLFPLAAYYDATVEFRAGAFIHSSKRFREIYGNVGACYEIEGSAPLYNCFDLWANFDWFSKDGRSIGFHDHTRVGIANVSFGLKYPIWCNNCFSVYLGIGPTFGRIWLKNNTECHGHEKDTRFAVGGVLKTGVNYYITQCIFLDAFADYIYQPVHFKHKHVDIGGVKVGLGIGTRF